VIERVQRWRTWAQRLRDRHARRAQRELPAAMTLLHRKLPVTLMHVAVGLPFTVMVAPRISFASAPHPTAVSVMHARDREIAAVPETVPGRVLENRAQAAAGEVTAAAVEAAVTRNYFVRRMTIAAEMARLLRLSRVVQVSESECLKTRSTAAVALEHTTLLRRRFRREESISTMAVRQVRQSVLQRSATHETGSPAPPPERTRAWAAPPHQPVLPSLDSITDHVIQQIDRKLVAHRERMGRI
jgi:hypothetical protein